MHIEQDSEQIISCGLPKFMNMGDGKEEYCFKPVDLLKAKDVRVSTKIDGTCLIRYVQNNRVRWRTKQNFCVQMENAFEIDDFMKQYPLLADPNYAPLMSLIFEWVSPFNEIVVKYPTPQLTLIGGVVYDLDRPWHECEIKLYTLKELQSVLPDAGIPLVEYFDLQSEDQFLQLQKRMEDVQGEEGYVLRLNEDQDLVKLKSKWWLLIFQCKICFTTSLAVELWLYWKQPAWSEFQVNFIEVFGDAVWNKHGMPVSSAMFDGIKCAISIIRHIKEFCKYHVDTKPSEFEKLSTVRFNQLRLDICRKLRYGEEVPPDVMKKLILQNSVQMERKFDECF